MFLCLVANDRRSSCKCAHLLCVSFALLIIGNITDFCRAKTRILLRIEVFIRTHNGALCGWATDSALKPVGIKMRSTIRNKRKQGDEQKRVRVECRLCAEYKLFISRNEQIDDDDD